MKIKCLLYGHIWCYRSTTIKDKRFRYCARCGKEQLVKIFT